MVFTHPAGALCSKGFDRTGKKTAPRLTRILTLGECYIPGLATYTEAIVTALFRDNRSIFRQGGGARGLLTEFA